jgi:hypothetical protein
VFRPHPFSSAPVLDRHGEADEEKTVDLLRYSASVAAMADAEPDDYLAHAGEWRGLPYRADQGSAQHRPAWLSHKPVLTLNATARLADVQRLFPTAIVADMPQAECRTCAYRRLTSGCNKRPGYRGQ